MTDVVSEVTELYEKGFSRKQIAETTGYSKSYVDLIIRQQNGPQKRRAISKEQEKVILSLNKQGKSLREIGAVVGFSQSAVRTCIKKHEEAEQVKSGEPEPDLPVLERAEKIPRKRGICINGKKYVDVSEFYLGV